MPSNKRRLQRLVEEGKYTSPPILAADGTTDLRAVTQEWNAVAAEMTESITKLVDVPAADAALPRLKELAKRYVESHRTVWQSGAEIAQLREIVQEHADDRMSLEIALRQLESRSAGGVRSTAACDAAADSMRHRPYRELRLSAAALRFSCGLNWRS